jgi:ankyrin repeat protein
VRFRNTCLWFVEEKELGPLYGKKYKYTDWRDGGNSSPSLLWCSGRVGIGKSTLVSKLVDDMQRSQLGCAFFYTGVRTAHWAWDVMASLLQQFSELDGQYSPVLRKFLERSGSYEQPPLEILLKSLEELASTRRSTRRYIFLDAWDTENMQDPDNFAKILQSLLRTRWRIFITSRSDRTDYVANCDVSYRDAMISESWLECKIEPEDTEKDIQKYIKYEIDTKSTFQDFFSRDEKLRDVLLKTLSKKTDGLYFHAEIQTKLLLGQITSRDLRSTLENLPMSTEDIVEAALGLVTVQPFHLRTLAQTALIWLADQKRPFTMRGLCEALALRRDKQLEYPGSLSSPKADSIPCEDAVIGCCKGLVTIDYGESTAVLAHYYDLAPYLSRYWERSYRSELTYLTLTCVSYLLLQPFNRGTCESLSELSNLSEMNPFLHYAATCWHLHLRDFWLTASEKKSIPVGELVTEEVDGGIEGLIRDNWRLLFQDRAHNLRLAFQIYMWNRELGRKSEAALGRLKQRVDSMSPLQIATSLQLEDVVRHLLEHPSDSVFAESGLLKQDMDGQTALHAALDHARNPVPRGYDRRWVLFQLIFEKAVLIDFDMMEKSLDRIPSVIADGNHRRSELVQKNLRRILPGIEDGDRRELFHVYLNEIFGSHILSHAIDKKNKAALLAMLASNLPSNTDVSAALQDAVKLRSQEFVKVLLTFGADPYIITASGRSCVSEAIANDDLGTLTLLLQRSYYPAPRLRYSAGSADPTLARAAKATLLLEAIKPLTNPNIDDDLGCAMVKALLDQGFLPDALPDGHNPLMQAIKVGRDDIVKLLLERKADPNFATIAGLLPSFESLRCANSKILQFLLERGADPNAKFKGRTLLHEASSLARLDLVQTLLEFDADVNGPDDLGRTALFDAVKAKNLEIVRRFVDEGVNLLAKDQSNGRYVLHEAAIAGDVKIVSLLLSGYDDISPVDQKGKTPLDYAKPGHLGIVSLLETRFLIRRRS